MAAIAYDHVTAFPPECAQLYTLLAALTTARYAV
jgi:hypothetical protein